MKVYCPHTDLTPETRAALDASGYEWTPIDVSGSDTAYTEFLQKIWRRGETFAIVEHDIVPWRGALEQLDDCHHPWCGFSYPFGGGMIEGLGCTRFKDIILAAYPDAVDDTLNEMTDIHPRGHWCPTPDHRVLHADLSWRPIGEAEPGDELIAFDEYAIHGTARHYRNYQLAKVLNTESATADVLRIAFDDAPDLIVTPDHPLLACGRVNGPPYMLKWDAARNLTPGRLVPRYLEPVQPLRTFEAGYLAGLFDGEGCLQENGQRVSFSQKPGAVLDYGKFLLQELGFSLIDKSNMNGRTVETRIVVIAGGVTEGVKFLSMVRPRRLLAKLDASSLGVFRAKSKHRVAAVEQAGHREIRRVQTTTGTYLLEGMASHNCNLDDRLMRVLTHHGARRHVHAPPVGHLYPHPSHGCC
jgi:hypothetical protein